MDCKVRADQPDWTEYYGDVRVHRKELILAGELDLLHPTTLKTIDNRMKEMENRFRRTFYPQLDC